MTAYKLLRMRRDGSLGSLFIHRSAVMPEGVWMEAEFHPTPGYAPREGFHCTWKPLAPHLSMRGRVWCEVEMDGWTELPRPERQGGMWYLAKRMKILRRV